jgi:hypothetical protein
MSLLKKAVLFTLLLTPFAACAQSIAASEAGKHLGEHETVCGKIAEVKATTASPTFIYFDNPIPNQTFTAVIPEQDEAKVGTLPRAAIESPKRAFSIGRRLPEQFHQH